jgi:hypothetical protein
VQAWSTGALRATQVTQETVRLSAQLCWHNMRGDDGGCVYVPGVAHLADTFQYTPSECQGACACTPYI